MSVTNGDDPHTEAEISDSFREDTMKAVWHHTLVDPNQPRIKIGCVCVHACVCVYTSIGMNEIEKSC